MDIYLAETGEDGVQVYRDRSRDVEGEAPVVGFLGSPEAIRDFLGCSRDADIVLEWEIFAPVISVTREATGGPHALCGYDIMPRHMVGADPAIEWEPIDYQVLLEVIGDG